MLAKSGLEAKNFKNARRSVMVSSSALADYSNGSFPDREPSRCNLLPQPVARENNPEECPELVDHWCARIVELLRRRCQCKNSRSLQAGGPGCRRQSPASES